MAPLKPRKKEYNYSINLSSIIKYTTQKVNNALDFNLKIM